jgi:tRNA-binding protein
LGEFQKTGDVAAVLAAQLQSAAVFGRATAFTSDRGRQNGVIFISCRDDPMRQLKQITSYDDFARLDIRIGKVVDVQPFPRARNPSYKVGVDVGADRVMWSSAQITHYRPDELLGSQVVCVCNFGGKNIAGFTSELLILGAKNAAGNVILLQPKTDVAIGEPVF